ncbi:MAG: DUF669 domain-containing protein [Lentisphaeria bacterium]
MEFTTDYSDVDEGGILPIGEYEAIIKYAGEDTVQTTGTVYINVTMVARNDVEQPCKNKYIWHKLWHRKEPTPADVKLGGYSSKQINALSKSAGLPNGKKYASLAEWCEELGGKCVRITVEHEEYKGKTQAKVKWVNESKHPECRHVWKDQAAAEFTELPNDDGELPF